MKGSPSSAGPTGHEGRDRFFALQGELVAATDMQNEVIAIPPIAGGAIPHQRGRARDGCEDDALLLFSLDDGPVVSAREHLFDHAPFDALVGDDPGARLRRPCDSLPAQRRNRHDTEPSGQRLLERERAVPRAGHRVLELVEQRPAPVLG